MPPLNAESREQRMPTDAILAHPGLLAQRPESMGNHCVAAVAVRQSYECLDLAVPELSVIADPRVGPTVDLLAPENQVRGASATDEFRNVRFRSSADLLFQLVRSHLC